MTLANQKPLVLRLGAIYRICGMGVGNYRGVAYGDYLIFSIHGKPKVVERERVELANAREVSYYLSDGKDK